MTLSFLLVYRFVRFNRTTVELKLSPSLTLIADTPGFNRTTVELKCEDVCKIERHFYCFNRTTVELKFPLLFAPVSCILVLIVPQWN